MTHPVNIMGVGTYFPERVVQNEEFDMEAAGVDPSWPEKAGFRERRHAAPHETVVDLAVEAGRRAIDHAGVEPEEIDRVFLISSTFRQTTLMPSGVVELKEKLSIRHAMGVFMAETCCGVLMAMDIARAYIGSGQARNVLIVASETFSKTFNPTSGPTFRIGMGMGDGAGAVVLTGRPDWEDGHVGSYFESNADFKSGLVLKPDRVQVNGSVRTGLFFGFGNTPPSYKGRFLSPSEAIEEIKRFTTRTVPRAIERVMRQNDLERSDIDFFVLHQPNRKFLDGWIEAAEIPAEKTCDTMDRFGNLSSVSVLANLDWSYQKGLIEKGDTLLMAAVGEGANWAATVWRWRREHDPGHTYLCEPTEPTVEDELITVENHPMIDIWEKFIIPGAKESYSHEELFSDFIPSMAVFREVDIEDAFRFLARTENMALWTMSMRNLRPYRGDIYQGEEPATPTGKVYIRTIADPKAKTIEWQAGHSDPDDLWIVYKGMLVDARKAMGVAGTAFFWTNFAHRRIESDPKLQAGFKLMFSAHRIEIQNLKKLLEASHASPARKHSSEKEGACFHDPEWP